MTDVARKPVASTDKIRSIRGGARRRGRAGRVGARPEVGRNILCVDNVWTIRYALATGVDTGLSDAKCGTSATTAECARRAF